MFNNKPRQMTGLTTAGLGSASSIISVLFHFRIPETVSPNPELSLSSARIQIRSASSRDHGDMGCVENKRLLWNGFVGFRSSVPEPERRRSDETARQLRCRVAGKLGECWNAYGSEVYKTRIMAVPPLTPHQHQHPSPQTGLSLHWLL